MMLTRLPSLAGHRSKPVPGPACSAALLLSFPLDGRWLRDNPVHRSHAFLKALQSGNKPKVW